MIVPKKIRDKWKLLKTGGDVSYIAGMLQISTRNVSRAFNGEPCSDEVFDAISEFYKKREEKIKTAAA